MDPVNPEELSAYLDGELGALRTSEIEAAIENDAATRSAYQIIAVTDSVWRAAALSSRFRPKIAFPRRFALESAASMFGVTVALLVVRALPKISDALMWGIVLQGAALIVMLAWVVVFAGKSPDTDESQAT